MILRPEDRELCVRFYSERQMETVTAHANWSANFYRKVVRFEESSFWQARSQISQPYDAKPSAPNTSVQEIRFSAKTRVRISENTQLGHEPCIVNDRIQTRLAIVHPSFDRPVAFIDGIEVGPLLEMVSSTPELGRLVARWSDCLVPEKAWHIAAWLLNARILEIDSRSFN
jgi:hypothetical protein